MAAIAYCTNCQANFTDPAEVSSIFSGPPFHCLGCASIAKLENDPADPVLPAEPESAANIDGENVPEPAASLEHVEGDLLVSEPKPPEPEPVPAGA